VENNTLGEAALVTIAELGEENIHGVFMTEPGRAGVSRMRKGFTTTNKSKITACAKLKNYIENKKMHLASKNLISELKTFVAHGTSFAAKPGENDDLVMAIILTIRMIAVLQGYDSSLDMQLRDQSENINPMPFIMM
jgi:hypothetical protein